MKYTLTERNNLADELCGKNNLVRLEDCIGYHVKFKAMTKEGYFVFPSIRGLTENKQPLIFDAGNLCTIDNLKTWLKSNNKNFELVSKGYDGSLNNLVWVCKNNKCKGYNKEFLKSWKIIQKGCECPECGKASRKETKQTAPKGESLFDKNFELCEKNWDYERNYKTPDFYYPNSNEKVYWKCHECGHKLKNELSINNVVRHGLSCPQCSDGISYPEKFMFNILTQLKAEFEIQKTFEWSIVTEHRNNKLYGVKFYDFWVESKNCIIETHGNQHYKQSKWKSKKQKTLKEEQENDFLKRNLAKDNNVDNYIVIDCKDSELEYIKNNILQSELDNLFNLSVVDWLKAHEYACTNKTKEICNLWNEGVNNTEEIIKITKLSRSVVINYLKKGSKIGWCSYNPKEEMKKNGILMGKKNKKSIVQVNEDGQFIKRYESISEAAELLDLQIGNISKVCHKHRKNTKGFIFIFEEEYKRNIV